MKKYVCITELAFYFFICLPILHSRVLRIHFESSAFLYTIDNHMKMKDELTLSPLNNAVTISDFRCLLNYRKFLQHK